MLLGVSASSIAEAIQASKEAILVLAKFCAVLLIVQPSINNLLKEKKFSADCNCNGFWKI